MSSVLVCALVVSTNRLEAHAGLNEQNISAAHFNLVPVPVTRYKEE